MRKPLWEDPFLKEGKLFPICGSLEGGAAVRIRAAIAPRTAARAHETELTPARKRRMRSK